MTALTYPSPKRAERRADQWVHALGLALIVIGGTALIRGACTQLNTGLIAAVGVYVACLLSSNLASACYHFAPWHERRTLLRRIDHAAIYLSITGTFTPFFLLASTTWTLSLLGLCWALTALAIWHKITAKTVKSRWSTASYLGLGAIGLSALPDLTGVPAMTLTCILAGAACYVIGTLFYARKSMPYRYAIWHVFVNLGGVCMFTGIWLALL